MAVRQTVSKRGTITAATALFLLGAWHAAPVLAASDRQVSHDIDTSDMIDLASSEDGILAKDHLLKPRVDATVREVFVDSEGKSLVEEEDVTDVEESALQELSAPRMTDGLAIPFKRQMYRKDI